MMEDVLVKLNVGLLWLKLLQQEKDSFTSTLDLELRKKLVKCCIWSVALYGASNMCSRILEEQNK